MKLRSYEVDPREKPRVNQEAQLVENMSKMYSWLYISPELSRLNIS